MLPPQEQAARELGGGCVRIRIASLLCSAELLYTISVDNIVRKGYERVEALDLKKKIGAACK
ncbi:MAG TPA: hypothetical protein VL528_02340 [Oxalicibacterium sp.]|nr:hypothetical protein [Oxalicibacterium sp.]